jgi:hypothetical protein
MNCQILTRAFYAEDIKFSVLCLPGLCPGKHNTQNKPVRTIHGSIRLSSILMNWWVSTKPIWVTGKVFRVEPAYSAGSTVI